jgi:hypothetical protein
MAFWWLWVACPTILHSAFCLLPSLVGGFARAFCLLPSAGEVRALYTAWKELTERSGTEVFLSSIFLSAFPVPEPLLPHRQYAWLFSVAA